MEPCKISVILQSCERFWFLYSVAVAVGRQTIYITQRIIALRFLRYLLALLIYRKRRVFCLSCGSCIATISVVLRNFLDLFISIVDPHSFQCGSGSCSGAGPRVLMLNIVKFYGWKNSYFFIFWSKIAIYLSLRGLYLCASFLSSWIRIKPTKTNADPDPQHCFLYFWTCGFKKNRTPWNVIDTEKKRATKRTC